MQTQEIKQQLNANKNKHEKQHSIKQDANNKNTIKNKQALNENQQNIGYTQEQSIHSLNQKQPLNEQTDINQHRQNKPQLKKTNTH